MESKMSKEMAVSELQQFVEKWDDKKKEDFEIEQDYPHLIQAMQDGFLVLGEDLKPSFQLKYPILTDGGGDGLSKIDFRTRIKPDDLTNITKGLDIGKNQMEFNLRCLAYLTRQPKAMLNKLEKFDYKVVEQICSIFL